MKRQRLWGLTAAVLSGLAMPLTYGQAASPYLATEYSYYNGMPFAEIKFMAKGYGIGRAGTDDDSWLISPPTYNLPLELRQATMSSTAYWTNILGEIDLLNEEIRKIMLTNFDLQTSIQKELELRHTYETEQRKIANYCNDLSLKFRNMEKTIADYENTVKSMKKQNEDLADAYDKKIEEIDKENKKLQKRIDDRIELYNHQKNEIYEKTAKVDILGVEIQRQKDLFNERNIMNKNKFEELQNKYKEMLKKVYELQLGIGLKKADGVGKVGDNLTPEEIKKKQNKEKEKISEIILKIIIF